VHRKNAKHVLDAAIRPRASSPTRDGKDSRREDESDVYNVHVPV